MSRASQFSLALPLILASSMLSAQAPASTPTLQVFSRETVVDVVATDSKGNHIRRLHASDFVIKEDGRPQPIRGFNESTFLAAAGSERKPPRSVHTNYQATPPVGPVNVILIDALHESFTGAARALQATAYFAQNMPEGTQTAVFWLSSSGLHLLQGFTSDRELLLDVTRQVHTDIGSDNDCHTISSNTIDALQQIAEYVAPIKGRKNLLWITHGMPVYLVRDGGYSWGRSTGCAESSESAYLPAPASSTFQDYLVQSGQRAADQVSIRPGWDGAFASYTSNSPVLFPGSNAGLDMGTVHRLMDIYEAFTAEQIAVSPVDTAGVGRLGQQQLIAEQVAQQSGGRASYNTNDVGGRLVEAAVEGSHYYTVSYVPPRSKPDGHYHRITVELSIPGAHLVYRRGYNAEDPHPRAQPVGPELIRTALRGRVLPPRDVLFDARLIPAPVAAQNASAADGRPGLQRRDEPSPKQRPYDLTIGVPQSQIASTVSSKGVRHVSLRFAFDAYDLNGKFLGQHTQDYSVDLTADRFAEFSESPVIFHERIFFYPGPLFLRVGVLDQVSNKVGTLEIPVTIPKP